MKKENFFVIGANIKRYDFGLFVLVALVIFNFLETWYFGWNATAISSAERICDVISIYGSLTGLLIMLWSLRPFPISKE